MILRAALLVVTCLVSEAPLRAAEPDLTRSKPQAAQVVTLARLGSILCPELDVDEQAVQELMNKAGITDKDITDPGAFGPNDIVVARSFARSFVADPGDSCAKLYVAFGPGNGQLLRRAERPI